MNGFKKVVLFLKVIVCLLAQRRFRHLLTKWKQTKCSIFRKFAQKDALMPPISG